MKNLINSKWFSYAAYILLLMAISMVCFVLFKNSTIIKNVVIPFFEVAENRTFDYRQGLKIAHKQPVPNKDIVILAIDEASLENLWGKYGEWPVPRSVYASLINHIEKDNPQAIIFDLLFLKSMKADKSSDKALVDAMNGYNNIYTGMNFDSEPMNVRVPAKLPSKMEINVENLSNIKSDKYTFRNCRTILPELMEGQVHVGMTNVIRNSDGIIRKIAPILKYQGKKYPYLAFMASSNYITNSNMSNFVIDKHRNLSVADTILPLSKDGEVILNWYGKHGVYENYPLYKVIDDIDNKKKSYNFKDKIVIIGTTAMSLHDTKSVPVDDYYPGCEIHATFFNNMLDNNFIKQSNLGVNLIVYALVALLVGLIVITSSSTIFAILSTVLLGMAYLLITYYAMIYANLWLPIVIPMLILIMSFALSYIIKYLIKSRDFEYQYKLATVDGLTDLYNHRYFQDTLRQQVAQSKRYNQSFSLIMIDIDFFKKFNDTYGHQAGDAVLKQVAKILKKNSRTTDYVCRYGGEEMAIILPNTTMAEALYNAGRIRKAVAEKDFQLNATEKGHVTISIGVSTFPDDASTPEELIEKADKGLYFAKEHGRNQVGRYSE